MSVGERKIWEGSAISPATAPSTAASPQPIASIESTRPPTNAADAGHNAAGPPADRARRVYQAVHEGRCRRAHRRGPHPEAELREAEQRPDEQDGGEN